MLCDVCKKNPATVHLTEIVDDQMTELHLCEECARHKSAAMEQQFGLSDLLAGMADFGGQAKNEEPVSAKCPNCNLTYADFKKVGRLGCGECYNAFRKYLAPLLKRIHGSSRHVGKSPLKDKTASRNGTRKKPDLEELKAQMQRAVQSEDFEEAARLRDQIKKISSNAKEG
jgi:protein arginine kinase activator